MRFPITVLALASLVALARPTVAQYTERVGVRAGGVPFTESIDARISADGRWIAYSTVQDEPALGDTNGRSDVYLRDRWTGAIELISRTPAGAPGDDDSHMPRVNGDGTVIGFTSWATDLVVGQVPNGLRNFYVFDRAAGAVELVNVNSAGVLDPGCVGSSAKPDQIELSTSGRFVFFVTRSVWLAPGLPSCSYWGFVRDRQLGTTELGAVRQSGQPSYVTSLAGSDDADWIAWHSTDPSVVPGGNNGYQDVFAHHRSTGTVFKVSVTTTGQWANSHSTWPQLSDDGRYVAFRSYASNLVPDDTNGDYDLFVKDLQANTIERASVSSTEEEANNGVGNDYAFAAGGRHVLFTSDATNLVPGDTNGVYDAFLRDLDAGTTVRVSEGTGGIQTKQHVNYPYVSGDGAHSIFYLSKDDRLIPGDVNAIGDWFAYVRDVACEAVRGYCAPKTSAAGCRPLVTASGVPSATAPEAFFAAVTWVPKGAPGLFVWSLSNAKTPFAGGTLCVAPPLVVSPVLPSGSTGTGACSGAYTYPFAPSFLTAHGLAPGTEVFGQFWLHDPARPGELAHSNGLRFVVCP